MSQVLTLKSGTTTVMDLLSGNLRVKSDGWSPQTLTGSGDKVWDTFNLIGRGSTEGAVATAIYNTQEFVSLARRNANNVSWEGRYWLHYKPEGGTELHTLVTDGIMNIEPDPGFGGLGPLMNSDGFVRASLALEHMPWWEGLTLGTVNTSGLSLTGGEWMPSMTSGDLSGRINKVEMRFGIGTIADVEDLWLGIRPYYAGTANFNACWECELGVPTNGAITVADATVSNGTMIRVNFSGTTGMVQRLRISASQGAPNAGRNMSGRYLVLGRIKCGTATECLIDLYHGLAQAHTVPQGIELVGETKVTNNDYKLLELGQVQIPPSGLKVFDGEDIDYIDTNLYIYAQQLTGSSYLYLDCLILIPCEHMLIMKNAGMDRLTDAAYYRSGSDGKSLAFRYDTTSEKYEIIEHSINDLTWPSDGGIVVIAGQGSTTHNLAGTATIGIYSYPRYSLIRV